MSKTPRSPKTDATRTDAKRPVHRSLLLRNGLALIASSGITAALGVGYWVFAARRYSETAVGLNGAAISAMMFIAGIAQLNLMSALVRFIPTCGKRTTRFVSSAYGIAISCSVAMSVAFVWGVRWFSPSLEPIVRSQSFAVGFVIATAGWTVFVLQDNALAGLRKAVWVPVENGVFAVGKLILLVLLVTKLPTTGIFWSWALALTLSIIPTNALIFVRLIPAHMGAAQASQSSVDESYSAGNVARFVALDYVASLFWLGSTALLPVMVTQIAGAKANARFVLAWSISYSLYLVSSGMGISLVAESSHSRHDLAEHSRRAWKHTIVLVLPIATLIFVAAPELLLVFGVRYSHGASGLLRLLVLSALPNAVTALYVSVARVERAMRAVIGVVGTISSLVIVLTVVLLPHLGIAAVGWAWLIAQTAVAAYVLPKRLIPLWAS